MELSPFPGKRFLWGPLLLLLGTGCARVGPPPGGPPDTSAPLILDVAPVPGATGVPREAVITFSFDEKIDPAGVEKALWVTPGGLSKPKISVSGAEVRVRSTTPFPDSSTVAVLVTTLIQDRRQNFTAAPRRWVFSTGDRIWPGVVRGKVVRKEEKGRVPDRREQILVGLYPAGGDTVPDPSRVPPVAITQADSALGFVLDGVRAEGERLWLLAMVDRDGNRMFNGSQEFVTAEPESVVLLPGSPVLDAAIRLVDPSAPGTLKGSLERSEGDTTAVWVDLFSPDADSTTAPVKRARAGEGGEFVLSQVPAGVYILSLFCDLDADGKAGPAEPRTVYGRVQIYPERDLDIGSWSAPVCAPVKEP